MSKQKFNGKVGRAKFTIKQTMSGIVLAATLVSTPAVAAEGESSADTDRRPYHISSGTLSHALIQFAGNAGLMLSVDARLTDGKNSQGLDGEYTIKEGLKKLLTGSGLSSKFIDSKTIAIVPQEEQQNKNDITTLPKVNVVGNTINDVKDPYNEDYVLPNATSGTKTDTPIMETPLNVQTISKQVLKDQQVIRLEDAIKNVSGVTFGSFQYGVGNALGPAGGLGGYNSSQFTLRGFADSTFFRDGFRLQQGAASREMANIESIEVLKGSAAILYGQVEPGGMVNVITKKPLETPYYSINQQFGSYNLYRTTVDATGPLIRDKSLLYRVNLAYENSGSFRDLVFNDNVFFAPVVKWNISDKTQATVELEYQHKNFVADTGYIPFKYQNPITGQGIPANVPFSNNYGQYTPGQMDTLYTGLNWSHQFNDDWTIKHRVSANRSKTFQPYSLYQTIGVLDQNTLNYLNGFGLAVPANVIGKAYGITGFNNLNYYNTYATNLDLIGHFDTGWLKHTLLLGGDYYRVDTIASGENNRNSMQNYTLSGSGAETSYVNLNNPQQGINWPGVPDPGSYSRNWNKTHQFGLYLQDQIKLPYEFFLTGGLRYQYINQGGNSSYMSDPSTLATTPNQPITQDAITPRFGLLWHPLNWLSSYINYTESFGANTPGFMPGNKVVPPTSAQQYEGGLKFEFFDGRLRATTAYYDLTKTNVAATDPNVNDICNGQAGSCYVAIGAVNSHGPEVDIQGELLKGWNMIGTYSYTDINITKTDSKNNPFENVYPIGTRYWGVPHNKASLFSTYEFQVDDLKGLKFGGGVNIQDSSLACCSAPLQNVPGFATLDLLSAYSFDIGKTKVSAQLNVKNLLDHRYYLGMAIENTTTGGAFANFGTPMTIMGSINVQY